MSLLPAKEFGTLALGRSMTIRGGLLSSVTAGTRGWLERISTTGPDWPGSTRTLRTTAGGSVVASNCALDGAATAVIAAAVSMERATNRLRRRDQGFIGESMLKGNNTTGMRQREVAGIALKS